MKAAQIVLSGLLLHISWGQLNFQDGICGVLNPCLPSAICQIDPSAPIVGEALCICPDGFHGDGKREGTGCRDINECLRNPCGDQAECVNTIGSYKCVCKSGFAKDHAGVCVDNNECLMEDRCGNHAFCVNTPGSYKCSCKDPTLFYDLTTGICRDPDECIGEGHMHNCDAVNGICINEVNGFQCLCKKGYRLMPDNKCQDIDECALDIHDCDPATRKCENVDGGYTCVCDEALGYSPNPTNPDVCENLNECRERPSVCGYHACCRDLTPEQGRYDCTPGLDPPSPPESEYRPGGSRLTDGRRSEGYYHLPLQPWLGGGSLSPSPDPNSSAYPTVNHYRPPLPRTRISGRSNAIRKRFSNVAQAVRETASKAIEAYTTESGSQNKSPPQNRVRHANPAAYPYAAASSSIRGSIDDLGSSYITASSLLGGEGHGQSPSRSLGPLKMFQTEEAMNDEMLAQRQCPSGYINVAAIRASENTLLKTAQSLSNAVLKTNPRNVATGVATNAGALAAEMGKWYTALSTMPDQLKSAAVGKSTPNIAPPREPRRNNDDTLRITERTGATSGVGASNLPLTALSGGATGGTAASELYSNIPGAELLDTIQETPGAQEALVALIASYLTSGGPGDNYLYDRVGMSRYEAYDIPLLTALTG